MKKVKSEYDSIVESIGDLFKTKKKKSKKKGRVKKSKNKKKNKYNKKKYDENKTIDFLLEINDMMHYVGKRYGLKKKETKKIIKKIYKDII